MSTAKHDKLKQNLEELKLSYIAENYRELLDDAARKNTSVLDVLLELVDGQINDRRNRAYSSSCARCASTGKLNRWLNTTSTSPNVSPSKKCSGCSTASSMTRSAARC